MRSAVIVALALAAILIPSASATADGRVALVIGNAAYRHVPALPNPTNDAADVAASLQRLGFAVTHASNFGFDDMRKALIAFGRQSRGAEVALIYFAGHGMEVGGENWLVPIDAELRTDADAENEAVSLRSVMLQVNYSSKLGLVILDACRNNPFVSKMQRSSRVRAVERGLVRTEPADNVLVAYASRDGTTANDGSGRNSPFTTALLRHIETPGLEVRFLFASVRDDVMEATRREQQPFVYGSLSREQIFLKLSLAETPPTGVIAIPAEIERAWASMQTTTSIPVLEEFIRRFGDSSYAALARARIVEIEKTQQVAALPTREPAPSGDKDVLTTEAIKSALPNNIRIDPEILRLVQTHPFFANAPPVRANSYRIKSQHSLSKGTALNDVYDVKVRPLNAALNVYEESDDHSRTGGSFRSKSREVTLRAGTISLGASSDDRSSNNNKITTSNFQRSLIKLDQLEGTLFPMAVGKKYRYRTTMREKTSSPGDFVNEVRCEVKKELPATAFHRDLKGKAFVIDCRSSGRYSRSLQEHVDGEKHVFVDELGVFLGIDALDKTKYRRYLDQTKQLAGFTLQK